MELRWPHSQRNKIRERSNMMMGGIVKEETERQNKPSKRKAEETNAYLMRQKKAETERALEASRLKEAQNF